MRRREFITLLGGSAAAWPRAARAQQPARVPRIGWIAIGTPQGSEFFDAVRQGLRQLGYVEGRSVVLESRWAADIRDHVPELVRELLALNVQVIVAQGAIVPVVRRAIDSTPVVFGYSGDPVEAGLVNSFSRPGGNFTGATFMSYELNAKRVELLRETFPHVKRVAILSNPLHPGDQRELQETKQGAERLGIALSFAQMRSVAEIQPAFEHIRASGAGPHSHVLLHAFALFNRERFCSDKQPVRAQACTMKYFFHLEDGECIRDPKGEEFSNDDAALVEAATVAQELSKLRVHAYEWHVVVMNAEGLRVGSVPLVPPAAHAQGVPIPPRLIH